MFETLFLASITATKSIFYLVGFLAPWFLTKISSKKVNHKNPRIFLTYVPPSLSSAAYLPLPLPTTTCRCLPLPATKSLPATTCTYLLRSGHYLYLPLPATACNCLPMSTTTCFYLTISYYLYWPSPANTYLSPDPFAQIASADMIQQTRMPNQP